MTQECLRCGHRYAPGLSLGLCPNCLVDITRLGDPPTPVPDGSGPSPVASRASPAVPSANGAADVPPGERADSIPRPSPIDLPGLDHKNCALPGGWDDRHEIGTEIARGGMGVVFAGRDDGLGRTVALKVLRPELQMNRECLVRFIEEAQIAGRLQHPGITPIYDLGQMPDQRPYFTMKLVEGRTLADLIARRGHDPSRELPQLLAIFAQVCQTVAFAHARHVIHRDLKPANIMIGAFGEVQVMDWGLAKELPAGVSVVGESSPPPDERRVPTGRRVGRGCEGPPKTLAGAALGTPAYLPPEQARGELDPVDRRADVFGLGAILAEILTGQPVFLGDADEALRQARAGELTGAFARLDACGAEPELTTLARQCLAPSPEDRPADASAVAAAVQGFQTAFASRVRQAERELAASEARMWGERRRRRLAFGVAACLVGILLVAGGIALWRMQQLERRQTRQGLALHELKLLVDQAQDDPHNLARWEAAERQTLLAGVILREGTSAVAQHRWNELEATVMAGLRAANGQRDFIDSLRRLRGSRPATERDKEFSDIFAGIGVDFHGMTPVEIADRLRRQPTANRQTAEDLLCHWLDAGRHTGPTPILSNIVVILNGLRPSPWRAECGVAVLSGDRARWTGLADRMEEMGEQPPALLLLLGTALNEMEEYARALKVLQHGCRRYPWRSELHTEYAAALRRSIRAGGANIVREAGPELERRAEPSLRAAIALEPANPRFRLFLALCLSRQGRLESSKAEFAEAVRLAPTDPNLYRNFGITLRRAGDGKAAVAVLEQALAISLTNQIAVDSSELYLNLAEALEEVGRPVEAEARLVEGARRFPDSSDAHYNLARFLARRERFPAAVEEYHLALAFTNSTSPFRSVPDTHLELVSALRDGGRSTAAWNRLSEAIRLFPMDLQLHLYRANGLRRRGQVADAIRQCQAALPLASQTGIRSRIRLLAELGKSRLQAGDYAAGRAELESALKLATSNTLATLELARFLRNAGEFTEALPLYLGVVASGDKYAVPQVALELGDVLIGDGQLDGARAAYLKATNDFHRAIREGERPVGSRVGLAYVMSQCGRHDAALALLEAALDLNPDSADAHQQLAVLRFRQLQMAEARRLFVRAYQLQPERSEALSLMRVAGDFRAEPSDYAAYQRGRTTPTHAAGINGLARLCFLNGKPLEAVEVFERVLSDPVITNQPAPSDPHQTLHFVAGWLTLRAMTSATIDAAEKRRLRGLALRWLGASLAQLRKQREHGDEAACNDVRMTLDFWLRDEDLMVVRGQMLGGLPAAERAGWTDFWAQVRGVLQGRVAVNESTPVSPQ